MILWFTETLVALILYLMGIIVKPNIGFFGFILLLKGMHFICYYWVLFLLYIGREEDFSVKYFCVTNTSVFLVISFFLSVLLFKDFILFFDYTFVCNLSGILLAPYLLKKLNNKLPDHLRIY